MNLKDREGSLMIESLVAISITLISLLGVFALLSQSIALNKNAGQKFLATYLAAEGIEVARSIVDANYTAPTYPNSTSWNSGVNNGSFELSYNSDVSALALAKDLGHLSTTPLNFISVTGVYGYDVGRPTPFVRTVEVTNVSGNEIKVVSIVNWSERGTAQSVSLEDHFFNWRP